MSETLQAELELEGQIREKMEQELADRRATLEAEFDKRLTDKVREVSDQMQKENTKVVQEAIEKFRKEMAPPSEKDIQQLLEQEYIEFKVEVPYKGEKRVFTLKELPHAVEKRIFKKIKTILVPFASDLAAISLNLLQGDAAKKIVDMMNTFEPLLDCLVGICAICLNPFDEDKNITEEWVAENISSTRIVQIITAQVQCNRIRDFFSLVFQGSKLATR